MEKRKHTRSLGKSEIGKSTVFVKCPFCGVETECYTWSLYGSGKRCRQCGAVHHGIGYTEMKERLNTVSPMIAIRPKVPLI